MAQLSKNQSMLTGDQVASFRKDGYVIIPNAVPQDAILAARRAIYSALDNDGLDPAWLEAYREQSFAPELRRDSRVLGLLSSEPLISYLESIVGAGNIRTEDPAYIRLGFPTTESETSSQLIPAIDGWVQANTQFPQGNLLNYTAHVIVQLNDQSDDECGGTAVWPGGHEKVAQFCEENGAEALQRGFPNIELPVAQRLSLKSGDAAIVHYLTPRTQMPNRGPDINTSVHFRVHHVDHYSTFWNSFLHWAAIEDPWKELPGVFDHAIS